MDQIIKLKTENSRRKYYVELYATYLQLVEICGINMLVLTEGNTKHLFSRDIRAQIKERFKDDRFLNYFLDNWVFGVQEKGSIQNYESKRNLYKSLLKESVGDYCDDFHFLNSYKHGFRVYALGSNSLSIGREGGKDAFLIKNFNAQVFCFYNDKAQTYKMEISFNWQNIAKKSLLFSSALDNMKKVYLAHGKRVKLDHYFVTDHKAHVEHSGRFKVVHPINHE